MAIKVKMKYDKYWGDFEKINPLLFVASVLDPRYKMVILEFWFTSNVSEEKAKKITTKLKNALEQLYDHYDKNVGVGGSRNGLSNEDQSCEISASMPLDAARAAHAGRNRKDALKDFHSFWASKNLLLCQTEIERYFAEDVEPPCETFDALMWWKINSGKFPVLSEVARDVLAIPITIVASELAFSTGGRVIDPFRSSLAPKTVEALICTQYWLRSSWVSEHDELHQTTVEDEDSYKLDLEIMSDSITFDN
ncbi:zinc finger BED domain-containing protein RICESLEEPER 1-like [Alnus glutinosa]|uniref:zinc finger BED domain-containing protein RICESLEEPER 1-like n=1 Tax=Alnus glutinosa TaxID=3517 RepID=UPI002D78BE85|nr:zinc finger BED domain-containing protein RICESLEEPER 1-like [Alnus glutinosa]